MKLLVSTKKCTKNVRLSSPTGVRAELWHVPHPMQTRLSPASQNDSNTPSDARLSKISTLPLDLHPIPCNNYPVQPGGFGGVSVWQKYDFKRVNPSRTLCAASSARCNRKTLSRRSSATPFT